MSEANVGLVRRFYAADDQTAALAEMSAPDAVFDLTDLFLDQPLLRGHDEALRYLQASPWASLRFDPEHYFDVDDERVLVLVRTIQTGRASGVTLETRGAQEFTFRDGLLVRYKVYPDQAEALKAAGVGVREGATMPDLVELTRKSMEATNRGELDASATLFAADAVFDVSSAGVGCFEGITAVHGYLADWASAYEKQEMRDWKGWHLGNGVVFVVTLFAARPVGSQARVQERWAFTVIWAEGLISRVIASRDVEMARAAAARLAEERG